VLIPSSSPSAQLHNWRKGSVCLLILIRVLFYIVIEGSSKLANFSSERTTALRIYVSFLRPPPNPIGYSQVQPTPTKEPFHPEIQQSTHIPRGSDLPAKDCGLCTSGTYRVHSPQFFARGSDVLHISPLTFRSYPLQPSQFFKPPSLLEQE
jgi:hypothetical protein